MNIFNIFKRKKKVIKVSENNPVTDPMPMEQVGNAWSNFDRVKDAIYLMDKDGATEKFRLQYHIPSKGFTYYPVEKDELPSFYAKHVSSRRKSVIYYHRLGDLATKYQLTSDQDRRTLEHYLLTNDILVGRSG